MTEAEIETLSTDVREIHAYMEARRDAEEDREDKLDRKLTQFMELQADEAIARAKRRKAMKKIMGWLVGVFGLGGGGGSSAYFYMRQPPPPVVQPAEVQETVEKRTKKLERQQGTQAKKIERLGDLHFEQRDLILQQGDEIRDKLDAISPKAREIDEPDAVEDAREEVRAYKERKRMERPNGTRKGDPFWDIEQEARMEELREHVND